MIWLLAIVVELAIVVRIIAYGWLGDEPAVTGAMMIWSVLALVGIPVAAWLVTRLLRREYRAAGEPDVAGRARSPARRDHPA